MLTITIKHRDILRSSQDDVRDVTKIKANRVTVQVEDENNQLHTFVLGEADWGLMVKTEGQMEIRPRVSNFIWLREADR